MQGEKKKDNKRKHKIGATEIYKGSELPSNNFRERKACVCLQQENGNPSIWLTVKFEYIFAFTFNFLSLRLF